MAHAVGVSLHGSTHGSSCFDNWQTTLN